MKGKDALKWKSQIIRRKVLGLKKFREYKLSEKMFGKHADEKVNICENYQECFYYTYAKNETNASPSCSMWKSDPRCMRNIFKWTDKCPEICEPGTKISLVV